MKIRSAAGRLAASAIVAPRWLAVVATETWADGFADAEGRPQPPDEPRRRRGLCWITELFDVDVDPVDTKVAGQRHELADRPPQRASEFVKNASFLRGPEQTCRRARSARRGRGRRARICRPMGPVIRL